MHNLKRNLKKVFLWQFTAKKMSKYKRSNSTYFQWKNSHGKENIFIKTVKKPSKLQQQKKVIIQNYRATVAHNTISANQRSDSVTQSLSTNPEETIKFFIYTVFRSWHKRINKVMATLLFSIGLVFVFCHTTKLVSSSIFSSKFFIDNISFIKVYSLKAYSLKAFGVFNITAIRWPTVTRLTRWLPLENLFIGPHGLRFFPGFCKITIFLTTTLVLTHLFCYWPVATLDWSSLKVCRRF